MRTRTIARSWRFLLPLVLGLAALSVTVTVPASAQPSTDPDAVTVVYHAPAASLIPQADGSLELKLDNVSDTASYDIRAPKGADPTKILDGDADGAIPTTITADGLKGKLRLVAGDFHSAGNGDLAAVVSSVGGQDAAGAIPNLPPSMEMHGVTMTAKVDGPAGDESTASSTAGGAPGSTGASSSSYTIDMEWFAGQMENWPSTWQFTPLSSTCVTSTAVTKPLEVQYPGPKDPGGYPSAETTFPLVVDTSGDCFWKFSSLEFQVTLGDSWCRYKVQQIGPRTFTGKSTLRTSDTVRSCDAFGGINHVRGNLFGVTR